jgi:putative membrane protein
MKRKPFVLVVPAVALAVSLSSAAYGQSVTERASQALGMTPSAKSFVETVAISDMFEIESSKLAQQKADSSSKTFAAKMISDHTKSSNELKAAAAKAKIEVPTALDSSHQSKLDKLKSLNGADFDKQYDADQLAAHKDAVSLFDRYAKGGDNADLKAFAAKTLPHLKQHQKMAEGLQKSTVGQKSR